MGETKLSQKQQQHIRQQQQQPPTDASKTKQNKTCCAIIERRIITISILVHTKQTTQWIWANLHPNNARLFLCKPNRRQIKELCPMYVSTMDGFSFIFLWTEPTRSETNQSWSKAGISAEYRRSCDHKEANKRNMKWNLTKASFFQPNVCFDLI